MIGQCVRSMSLQFFLPPLSLMSSNLFSVDLINDSCWRAIISNFWRCSSPLVNIFFVQCVLQLLHILIQRLSHLKRKEFPDAAIQFFAILLHLLAAKAVCSCSLFDCPFFWSIRMIRLSLMMTTISKNQLHKSIGPNFVSGFSYQDHIFPLCRWQSVIGAYGSRRHRLQFYSYVPNLS